MCLAQGLQLGEAGEARTLGLESSTLPLSHHTPKSQVGISKLYKSVPSIKFKLACADSEDSKQSAHLYSLISLSVMPEETLDPCYLYR